MTTEQTMVLIFGLLLVMSLVVWGLTFGQMIVFGIGLIALLGLVVGLGEWIKRE